VKKSVITALSVISIALWADPAPVADLSRTGTTTVKPKYNSTAERIEALERVVEARANAQLQMQQQVAALLDEVAELRGVTETQAYKIEELLQQQRDLYQELDRRLGGSSASLGGSSASLSGSSATASAPAPETTEPVPVGNPAAALGGQSTETPVEPQNATVDTVASAGASENDAYESAVNLVLKDRNYDAAIPAFEQFVQDYPESSYVPNSYYWLGQLFFTKNETLKAKSQFERVVSQYPQSSKAADALAKLAQLAEKDGDTAAAKQFYQLLMSKYPQSKPAKTAKAKLDNMR